MTKQEYRDYINKTWYINRIKGFDESGRPIIKHEKNKKILNKNAIDYYVKISRMS